MRALNQHHLMLEVVMTKEAHQNHIQKSRLLLYDQVNIVVQEALRVNAETKTNKLRKMITVLKKKNRYFKGEGQNILRREIVTGNLKADERDGRLYRNELQIFT